VCLVQAKNGEKPNSSLLSNMEMGNAAFWTNGDSAALSPEAGAGSEQQGASEQPAAGGSPPAAAPKQSEHRFIAFSSSSAFPERDCWQEGQHYARAVNLLHHLRSVACPADGTAKPSAAPDLTYMNDDSVAARAEPQTEAAPPPQQQPPQRSSSGAPGAWADVDL